MSGLSLGAERVLSVFFSSAFCTSYALGRGRVCKGSDLFSCRAVLSGSLHAGIIKSLNSSSQLAVDHW